MSASSKICIIGAGRVASHLAPALQRGGADIVEVWSRTRESATALADRLGCHASGGRVEDVMRDADVYIVSVRDDVLPDVLKALRPGREHALVAHTAGSVSIGLLREAGFQRGGVFYPLQTFSIGREVDFLLVHFFIETLQKPDEQVLIGFANKITRSSNIHITSSAERRHLHLAAVFACNFANHCFALADDVLHEADIPFDAMLPLIEETVAKLHTLPPAEAQTGPAVRGDENVMGTHMAMLSSAPDMQRIYRIMSDSIQKHTHD